MNFYIGVEIAAQRLVAMTTPPPRFYRGTSPYTGEAIKERLPCGEMRSISVGLSAKLTGGLSTFYNPTGMA
ncbi:MAG: hypothetical protein KHW59_06965, partial [Clostridiales bacterium]|nr:hypothetical protein [Clostridiales bacterium]